MPVRKLIHLLSFPWHAESLGYSKQYLCKSVAIGFSRMYSALHPPQNNTNNK